jgi:release factor glutamine methyltransferase
LTLDEAARLLADAGTENPRREARLLLACALRMRCDDIIIEPPVHSTFYAERFAELLKRRLNHEPLAYIAGHREFWSLDFAVGPGVLIPRPDTETLIEQALLLYPDRTAPLRIADLGTGSGAILLAALTEFPNSTGVGFEASDDAFNWAFHNAAHHSPGRAEIRLADWNQAEGPFDLVFSNPPYIPAAEIALLEPDVRDYEPRAALDGGPDGLAAYRALGALLPRVLRPSGYALLEIGVGQGPALEPLFPGLDLVRLAPDLAGIGRCAVLRAGKSLGNQGLIR